MGTLSPRPARYVSHELTELILLSTMELSPRGGMVLMMIRAFGQYCLISLMGHSYCDVTWLASICSESLPPHCSTTCSGGLRHDSRCGIRLRMYGISWPGYEYTTAFAPRMASLTPKPLTNEVPITSVDGPRDNTGCDLGRCAASRVTGNTWLGRCWPVPEFYLVGPWPGQADVRCGPLTWPVRYNSSRWWCGGDTATCRRIAGGYRLIKWLSTPCTDDDRYRLCFSTIWHLIRYMILCQKWRNKTVQSII